MLSLFQPADTDMKKKGRAPESRIDVFSQRGSGSRYCSYRSMSTIPSQRDITSAHQYKFDIVRRRSDAVIAGIQELKNNQVLIDNLLNNIINTSHVKPHVTCISRQAQKRKRV